jgi:CRISPR type I-E-associated protein CasB/Cse2
MKTNQDIDSQRAKAPVLNLGWLRAVCSEQIGEPGNSRQNPAFDAGVRARLRRGLERTTATHEDGALIGYLVKAGLDTGLPYQILPFQMTCAIYAWHPHALDDQVPDAEPLWQRGSFGTVCRSIAIERETMVSGHRPAAVDPQKNTFTPRFERLVHCRKLERMLVPLRSIVKMLVSSGMATPLSYRQLLRDLLSWEPTWPHDRGSRMRWMLDYWSEDRTIRQETEPESTKL